MARAKDTVEETKYQLNMHQWVVVKKDLIREQFEKLTFPILVLDLEFFNRSHNLKKLESPWCDFSSPQSYVYLIQFALYSNLRQLATSDPKKAIRTIALNRRIDNKDYSFPHDYANLVKRFMTIINKHKIRTIVLAGASNDQAIINSWLKEQNPNQELEIQFWDIYPTLEQSMAFANQTALGENFWDPHNLRPGFVGEQSLSLPSLKKFFNYMTTTFPNFTRNDDANIYHLSFQVLEFFCRPQLTISQYQNGRRALRVAQNHCFNDVYKLVTLLRYWLNLIYSGDELKNLSRI